MLFTDPPHHTRVRRLLHGFFSPESLVALRPRIDAILQDLLDALPVGVEFDFMSSLAHPLPALVIGEILGVPHSHWKQLMNWSDIFVEYLATLQAPIELVLEAERVISEMGSFLDELAHERRSHPSDDVISFMLATEKAGEKLSHQEFSRRRCCYLSQATKPLATCSATGSPRCFGTKSRWYKFAAIQRLFEVQSRNSYATRVRSKAAAESFSKKWNCLAKGLRSATQSTQC